MKRRVAILLAVLLVACYLPARASGTESTYSEYTGMMSASDGEWNNISLAAYAIDGTYIPYGGTFSFNDIVGPRTESSGYVSGLNGRGVSVIGGGVAQVATTLYLALLDIPGILYTEVDTYGDDFVGTYVSDGALAVVTDYSAGTDFQFENDEGDMTISMWLDDSYLYCSITVGAASDWTADGGSTLVAYSSFPLSGTSGLLNNVTRASDSISAVMLTKDSLFSFNNLVGPRSEEYGYVSAINGRGVNVVGGGVAQVASVIWLAAKQLDTISIVAKSTYGNNYTQSYVSSSADAILTDYSAGTDFSFRYTGDGTLIIYVYEDSGYLCCDIYESYNLDW